MTGWSRCSTPPVAQRTSGVQTDIRYAVVYTLRGGKIVRGREYIDRNQALEAVGLRE
jgi:ketosteroid isomerase-like protein